jgi:hypothetical protein
MTIVWALNFVIVIFILGFLARERLMGTQGRSWGSGLQFVLQGAIHNGTVTLGLQVRKGAYA